MLELKRADEVRKRVSGSKSLQGDYETPLNEVIQVRSRGGDLSMLDTLYDQGVSTKESCVH